MRWVKALVKPWPQPERDAWLHRVFRVYGVPIFIGGVLYAIIGPERGRTLDSPWAAAALIGLPLLWVWLAHRKTIRWRL